MVVTACTAELDEATRAAPIGEFKLDRLVVVVDEPIRGPVSRRSEDDAIREAVRSAVETRLRRFRGAGSYSIGIKVQGYVLAPPGIPVLLAPRSQLFLSVLAYDATPARINPEPLRLVVNERAGLDTMIGSGYTQSAEEQLEELAQNAAIEIERWLRDNAEWFAGDSAQASDPATEPGA